MLSVDQPLCPRCGMMRREYYHRHRRRLGVVMQWLCCCDDDGGGGGTRICSRCGDDPADTPSHIGVTINGHDFIDSFGPAFLPRCYQLSINGLLIGAAYIESLGSVNGSYLLPKYSDDEGESPCRWSLFVDDPAFNYTFYRLQQCSTVPTDTPVFPTTAVRGFQLNVYRGNFAGADHWQLEILALPVLFHSYGNSGVAYPSCSTTVPLNLNNTSPAIYKTPLGSSILTPQFL